MSEESKQRALEDDRKIIATYDKLHEGKLGAHWLWCVIEQIAAGVPEAEAMRGFGYYEPATERSFAMSLVQPHVSRIGIGFQDKAPAANAFDTCTDPYNCARCLTHPSHRGAMQHAGICPTLSVTPPTAIEDLLRRWVDQLGERDRGEGNAPGHGHDVPGVWDSDNGDKAGAACALCALWAEAKRLRAATPSPD